MPTHNLGGEGDVGCVLRRMGAAHSQQKEDIGSAAYNPPRECFVVKAMGCASEDRCCTQSTEEGAGGAVR